MSLPQKKANTAGCVKGQLIKTREVITLLSFQIIKAHQVIILFSSREPVHSPEDLGQLREATGDQQDHQKAFDKSLEERG